jgi:hypothetical protein
MAIGVAVALAATGCSSQRAARGPAGEVITLGVVFERGADIKNVDQVEQVTSFMQPDLEGMLSNMGYAVERVQDRRAFQPGPNRFLVAVRITSYYPGSKAARMFVGFGAGSLVLNTENELLGSHDAVLFRSNGSVGSSRDWTNAARKINQQIAREVTNFLAGGR